MDAVIFWIPLIVWAAYCIVPTVLLSFLQWYLCGKNLRWGKVLPIVSVSVSVVAFLFFLLFTLNMIGGGWIMVILTPIIALLLFNIPTLVYLLIYRTQKRRHAENDLTRMKIDDLE